MSTCSRKPLNSEECGATNSQRLRTPSCTKGKYHFFKHCEVAACDHVTVAYSLIESARLTTNLPKEVMQYASLPFDAALPSFLSANDVLDYLKVKYLYLPHMRVRMHSPIFTPDFVTYVCVL